MKSDIGAKLAIYPTPVYLIATYDREGKPNIMTVGWGGVCNSNPPFVYSWRLEPTDKLPAGKKPCLSLRELEKQIGYDLDSLSDPTGKNMTVEELVERYLSTKTGVKPNTLANYNFVRNLKKKELFNGKKISQVKTSDAKLFLIKLQ